MKKKEKWYSLEETKDTKLEKKLRRKARAMFRFCKRHGLEYCDIYMLTAGDTGTLNIRAKKDGNVVVNGYAFVR